MRSRRGEHHRTRWAAAHPHLATWSIDDLRSPLSGAATDRMQAALVALAQSGDPLALLTLTVQLRPGLLHLVRWATRRRSPASAPDPDLGDEIMSTFVEVVLRHSLDRRPRRIAANLLLDTRQKLYRASVGRGAPMTSSLDVTGDRPPAAASVGDHQHRVAERVDLTAEVAAALDTLAQDERSRRITSEAAYRAWVLGETSADVAVTVGLRPEAVRARLSRLRTIVRRQRQAQQPLPATVGR